MGYVAPLLPDLCKFIIELKSTYSKENLDHLNMICFIESLVSIKDPNAAQIILGACVYGLEKIKNEYYLFSPEYYEARFFSKGSTLYSALKKGLYISQINKLDDQQKLIYLVFLYDFLTRNNKHPEQIEELKNSLKRVLSRLDLEVNLLLKKSPKPDFLYTYFQELPQRYRQAKKNQGLLASLTLGYGSADREHYINLIDMINKNNPRADSDTSRNYSIRYGALLYIMHRIESEYHYLSPENSFLYRECQQILNVKKSTDLDIKLCKKYFADLQSFILDPENTDSFEEECVYLSNQLCTLTKCDTYSTDDSYLQDIAHHMSELGIKILLGEMAADFLKKICISEQTIIAGIGYISGTISPQTLLLCHLITSLLNDKIKTNVITAITEKMNTLIIHTATKPIVITYQSMSMLHKFLSSLLSNHREKSIGNINNMEWIYALMCLPDDIFPYSKKNIIKNVVELNHPMEFPKEENDLIPI